MAVPIGGSIDSQIFREQLEKCASTAMNSKLIHNQKGFFSKMVVDAVLMLDDELKENMIGMKKIPGGALEVNHTLCERDELLL